MGKSAVSINLMKLICPCHNLVLYLCVCYKKIRSEYLFIVYLYSTFLHAIMFDILYMA